MCICQKNLEKSLKVKDMKEGIVYSGSFNPFHIGHFATVEHLSKRFDLVLLVVSVQNPFKDKGMDNFNERIKNVREVIQRKGLKNVIVEDIEAQMQPPYYTINTLYKLEDKYPEIALSYCVGGDCLIDFDKWKDWEDILIDFGLVVIPRKGYNHSDAINRLKSLAPTIEWNTLWYLIVLNANIPEVSSTEIREKLSRGEDVSDLLP